MKTIPKRCPVVVVGQDDPSLTPAAGLVLVAEVDRILGVAATIDSHVGSIKRVATCSYIPSGWPEGTRTIVRRVRLDADAVRSDPRSRRRRTIDRQLALVLGGEADHVYAYSFIVTNPPRRPGRACTLGWLGGQFCW